MYPASKEKSGRTVGVVITARDCAKEIPGTIQSVLAQTVKPARIVVVEDGVGNDDIFNICLRYDIDAYRDIDQGKGITGNYARNHGIRSLPTVDYYWFIDGDGDYVPPTYLERCIEALEADCRAAVAYPALQFFGTENNRIHPDYSRDTLRRTNIAPVGSLVRADAFQQVGGWPIVQEGAHDDWALWQRLVEHGWGMVKANTEYYYRRHESSMSSNHSGRTPLDKRYQYHRTIDTSWNWCTVAIPFCGREETLHKLFEAIYSQTIQRQKLSFLFYDTSGSEHFRHRLREFLFRLDSSDVRFIKDWRRTVNEQTNREACDGPISQRPGNEINHRVAGIWNRIGQLVSTPYVWCLEDDVIPPPYALQRLWEQFNAETDGVSAAYRNRDGKTWNAGYFTSLSPARGEHLPQNTGPETVNITQMGCVLLRSELLRLPARSAGELRWYDWEMGLDWARTGKRLVCNWDVVCEHMTGI